MLRRGLASTVGSVQSAARAAAEAARSRKLPTFAVVDTTLREGEQFATGEFTYQDRLYIATTLDRIGVDYIELMNPAASEQATKECEAISRLGLRSKILTHTRCHPHDVSIAIKTGVHGINMYMATSPLLAKHSHGKGIDAVVEDARRAIGLVQDAGLEVRFSCEDSFRSNLDDILRIYEAVDKLGVDRVGVADTVGIATPSQVLHTVAAVRSVVRPSTGIEFHTHNDSGCCIANALMALEGGATHIDTTVLGIGERNGITPLGGFLARMYTIDKEAIKGRYDLTLIRHLEKYVAQAVSVSIPFNNYITGSAAFTHKAGVHSKAVMTNPSSYEVIDPADFGVERRIQLAHRLTGWNAMQNRATQLGLDLSEDQIKAATTKIKNLADKRSLNMDLVDSVLMRLASGPRSSSSTFVVQGTDNPTVKDAAERARAALAEYEAAAAMAAVAEVSHLQEDARPTIAFRVQGHLFDKALLNRLLDLAVDSPCDFEVEELHVAPSNDQHSSAVLRLWGPSDVELAKVRDTMRSLVDANRPIAECTLEVLL